MKRIGVLCSGGDAPGMNANVRAVVRAALERGITPYGIDRGYAGFLAGALRPLTSRDVSGIVNLGGTFLRTARCREFHEPAGRTQAAAVLRQHQIDGLVVCGGDGSFTGAQLLHREHGVAVVGTPGTIDNDLAGTDHTIGFDTAVQTAVEACDRIRDTAHSHDRVFVVEVMGRHAGFIALEVAVAAGAEVALLPEHPAHDTAWCCQQIALMQQRGKTSMLVVVAEGVGRGEQVAAAIDAQVPGTSARATVLGHVLRGGSPSSDDRVLASLTGADAVAALCEGATCHHCGVIAGRLVRTPLEEVVGVKKPLNPATVALLGTLAT
ncbi:MAG: 6-phosphofructokinase [Fimbriimonadaceae bacterium]|nr:6-phosphofructokinase [Fimbriimonadaceae bacterium]